MLAHNVPCVVRKSFNCWASTPLWTGKSIVTQLVARLRDGQYMAFGLSGDFDASV
jgi:hypothetical protein